MEARSVVMEHNQNRMARACLAAMVAWCCVYAGMARADSARDLDVARSISNAVADIAEKAAPAVVHVQALKKIDAQAMRKNGFRFRGAPDAELFRRFFGDPGPLQDTPEQKVPSQGSGFLIESDGIVVTNNHVVEMAEKIRVVLNNDEKYDADVVGVDPRTDIAVLRLKDVKKKLPFLPMGDSSALRIGEMVVAIGSPFGLDHTVTSGIVSAKGRQTGILGQNGYENFIQTDAAINPGNSGGPLINLNAEVIGINSSIMSGSGTNSGIGFAIPMSMARSIITQLLKHGKVTRGWLGIGIQDVNPDLATHFEGYPGSGGVLVTQVGPGMPADKAGIKPGDVVLEFDGVTIKDMNQFRNMVAMKPVGEVFPLIVLRDGKRLSLTAKIGLQAENPTLGEATGGTGDSAATPATNFGFTVQELTQELAEQLGYQDVKGVLVNEVAADSDAQEKGLQPGMVILEVNHQLIDSVATFRTVVAKIKEDSILLRVKARTGVLFLAVKKVP